MTFDEYQRESARYVPDKDQLLAGFTLGLNGEAGEVAELVKKWLYHDVPYTDAMMSKELGDVLWYMAALAREHGLSLAKIASGNLEKLRTRYPQGFQPGGGIRETHETTCAHGRMVHTKATRRPNPTRCLDCNHWEFVKEITDAEIND